MTRTLAAVLSFVALSLFPHVIKADGVVSPQVFTRGSFVYVVDQKQITFLSMDTRSAHTLYSSVDSLLDIVSVVRSGDVIWASNGMGAVIAVNMQTGTVEDFSRGIVGGGGYIDVDKRFVWLAIGDTLHRMDLTSRDWVKLIIPSKSALNVRGLLSFNEQVHVVTSGAVHILTTASDDWVTVPHKGFTLVAGDVRRVGDAVYFTQDKAVYRYDPSKRLFVGAAVRERIRAVNFGPDNYVDVVAGNRVYAFNDRSFSFEPMPTVPMLRDIHSITRNTDDAKWTIGATDIGLVTYTTPFNLSVAPYPGHVTVDGGAFVFNYSGHTMLYTHGGFVVYNPDRKLWSGVRIRNRGDAERKGQYGWDEDGAHVTFSDKYSGTPSGIAMFRGNGSAEYTDTSDLLIKPPVPWAKATLNLRTEDPDGRILDLTVDNAPTTLPPQKGFYYKGIDGDILSRASFGVQGTGLARSNVSSDVVTEGASAVFSGAKAIDGKDRNIVTGAAGSGYLLSKTEWRTMEYEPSGVYDLGVADKMREIIAKTVKVYVDGIPLPATDFIYDPYAHTVRLLRRDKTNPTSVVHIAFAERVHPFESDVFEPLPQDHFGQYNFVEGVASPREWISVRTGLLTLNREGSDLSPMALAGIPVEWRGAGGRSFLFYPEIAYDNRLGAQSAGVTAGVTEGRAFGSYGGRWVGRGFSSLDANAPTFAYQRLNDDRKYQRLNDEHEINVGYDIRDDFRASLYQVHRRTELYSLSNFELRAAYTGNALPDIEASASGLFLENNPDLETRDRSRKESFSLRLSDMSVRYISGMKGIHNVGYDFSWTEYTNNASEHGRVAYGMANFSPIRTLTFTGTAMYRLNPVGLSARSEMNPQLSVNMRDLPPGFDISAAYSAYVTDTAAGGSHVVANGNIGGYFYPGEYSEALKRLALYASCTQETELALPMGAQPMKYALISDDLTTSKQTLHEVGLLFFPTDNLLLSTLNSRYRDMKTAETRYTTSERANLLLQNGSKLEANVGASKSQDSSSVYGDALYEHRWASGLITGAGAFGSHLTEKDSASTKVETGPILAASFTKDFSGRIRSIECSNYLRITLIHGDSLPSPNIVYWLYFRLKMLPDISIEAKLGTDVLWQKTGNFGAEAYLYAGF